jgi:hypothetical protein
VTTSFRLRVLTPDDWRLWRTLRLLALEESPEAFGATLAEWTGPGDAEDRWRGRLTNERPAFGVRAHGSEAGTDASLASA